MDNKYQRLSQQVTCNAQDLGQGLSPSAAPDLSSAEDFIPWLNKSLEKIPKEFLPYCQDHVMPKRDAVSKLRVAARVAAAEALQDAPA